MLNIINNYDLFVFDLDDTLIKTEKYHYESWIKILQNKLGLKFYIDYNFFCSKFHSINQDNIKLYLKNDLQIKDIEEVIQQKNNYYLNLINNNKNNLKLVDGVNELIEKIIIKNKKFIIVSNSLKSNIDYFINLFPILKNSSKNYYRELFINKKPHPECYLKVIEDFPNKKIIGFEDSITGIHSITQVKNIDTIFINNSSYFYYNYIINNYKLKLIIENYNNIN